MTDFSEWSNYVYAKEYRTKGLNKTIMENIFNDKDGNVLLHWRWEASGWDLCFHTLIQWLEKRGKLEKPFNLVFDKEYFVIQQEDWRELKREAERGLAQPNRRKMPLLATKEYKGRQIIYSPRQQAQKNAAGLRHMRNHES